MLCSAFLQLMPFPLLCPCRASSWDPVFTELDLWVCCWGRGFGCGHAAPPYPPFLSGISAGFASSIFPPFFPPPMIFFHP